MLKILAERKHFPLLREYFIGFRPTYKYNPGSDVYDTSKKMRVPAWCDRVLFFENENQLYPISYERKESTFSDHRPVTAFFTVSTFSHDKQLMSEYKDFILSKEN